MNFTAFEGQGGILKVKCKCASSVISSKNFCIKALIQLVFLTRLPSRVEKVRWRLRRICEDQKFLLAVTYDLGSQARGNFLALTLSERNFFPVCVGTQLLAHSLDRRIVPPETPVSTNSPSPGLTLSSVGAFRQAGLGCLLLGVK